MAVKKELELLKQDSLAMEMLRDSKNANKRIAIAFASVIIVIVIIYFVTVGLFLKYISENGVEETVSTNTSQEIDEVRSIDNTNIVNGDMYGKNKAK